MTPASCRVRCTDRLNPPSVPILTERHVLAVADTLLLDEDFDGPRPTCVLLDAPSSRAVRELFGAFRDSLWEAPITWVVAMDSRNVEAITQPPMDAFFEEVLHLDELSEDDALELLVQRIPRSEAGAPAFLEQIVRRSPTRQPRDLLSTAADAMTRDDPMEFLDSRHDATLRASALGRTEGMLFAELQTLGEASASDNELLRRMGLSRTRIVQAMKSLEEAGLVLGRRAGRRVHYAPVEP